VVELVAEPVGEDSRYDFLVEIYDRFGNRMFSAGTARQWSPVEVKGPTRVVCHLPEIPLSPGRYSISLYASIPRCGFVDRIEQALSFDIVASDYYGTGRTPIPEWGSFVVRGQWSAEDHVGARG
jgi:hypothetical protein